jgi:hypothetical protein
MKDILTNKPQQNNGIHIFSMKPRQKGPLISPISGPELLFTPAA